MAKKIQAVAAYGPRIDLIEAADVERFMSLITQRTTLSAGVVKNVQESEVETLIGLLREGPPFTRAWRSSPPASTWKARSTSTCAWTSASFRR